MPTIITARSTARDGFFVLPQFVTPIKAAMPLSAVEIVQCRRVVMYDDQSANFTTDSKANSLIAASVFKVVLDAGIPFALAIAQTDGDDFDSLSILVREEDRVTVRQMSSLAKMFVSAAGV